LDTRRCPSELNSKAARTGKGEVAGFHSWADGFADCRAVRGGLRLTSYGKLPPLSDEEREQRRLEKELYRWERQQREEQRAFEHRRKQAEQAAEANRQAAIVAAQERQKAQRERTERIDREVRQREMADLRLRVQSQTTGKLPSNVR
jgi:hypothetical protein